MNWCYYLYRQTPSERNAQTATLRKWRLVYLPILTVISVDVGSLHQCVCTECLGHGDKLPLSLATTPSELKQELFKVCGNDLLKMKCNSWIKSKDLIRTVHASIFVHHADPRVVISAKKTEPDAKKHPSAGSDIGRDKCLCDVMLTASKHNGEYLRDCTHTSDFLSDTSTYNKK